MLTPFRQFFPITLAPTDSQSFVVESSLSYAPVLGATLFFRSISDDPVSVSLNHTLDLGMSDSPDFTGTHTTQLFSQIVGSGDLLWHNFPSPYLTFDKVYHTVTVTTSGASGTVYLQCWLDGTFEESLG